MPAGLFVIEKKTADGHGSARGTRRTVRAARAGGEVRICQGRPVDAKGVGCEGT